MDMEPAFLVKVDKSVNLIEAPVSGEHYLKQVALDRSKQPAIVTAQISYGTIQNNVTIKLPSSVLRDTNLSQQRVPSDWQQAQVANFSDLRQRLTELKDDLTRTDELPRVSFPSVADESAWKVFCFRKRCSLFTPVLPKNAAGQQYSTVGIEEFVEPCQDHALAADVPSSSSSGESKDNAGTPPYLRLVLALPQSLVCDLLNYHVEWLLESKLNSNGIALNRARWLYALLAVIEKPLVPDTCSTMRQLARFCIEQRSKLPKEANFENSSAFRSLSWFICIIAKYFDQTDLGD